MEFPELGPLLQVGEAFWDTWDTWDSWDTWDTWDTWVRHGNHLDPALVYRINTSAMVLFTAWNRLVPLAIAAFRYVMVCHAVAVHNHGGEKQVIDIFPMLPELFTKLLKTRTFI